VCAIVALLVSGDLGHSAAIHPAVAIPTKVVHLLAGATWLGGLLWIALADGTLPRYDDGVRRISGLALVAAIVVAASGILQMFLFLPSARSVVDSAYGLLALAKVAGLVILVLFGAYHRYRLVPRLLVGASVPLRSSVRGELAVMLLVVLIGGVLAYVPPGRP
jgi:putative copper export protein